MRITGGSFGGRNLKVPKSDTIRPTQDRVREALFNMLAPEIAGADFLDLFAGSGAVGLEAISRGAASVTFVEANRRHASVLQENLNLLCPPPPNFSTLIIADCYRWLAAYSGSGFSIAFADPPYALGEEKGYADVLRTLAQRNVVRVGGLFIAEMTAETKIEAKGQGEGGQRWELLRDRMYGKTRLCIWRRLPLPPPSDFVDAEVLRVNEVKGQTKVSQFFLTVGCCKFREGRAPSRPQPRQSAALPRPH